MVGSRSERGKEWQRHPWGPICSRCGATVRPTMRTNCARSYCVGGGNCRCVGIVAWRFPFLVEIEARAVKSRGRRVSFRFRGHLSVWRKWAV